MTGGSIILMHCAVCLYLSKLCLLQDMIYLIGSELLSYQIDLAFDCDIFAPAKLTDFAIDCKFETAESAISTAIWLCTHLDRSTYPSEYKECYTQQTLLLLLYRPHKKDSAYQKLLDGYLNQDDLLICLVEAVTSDDLETADMLFEEEFLKSYSSTTNSIFLQLLIQMEKKNCNSS